ncbi:pgk-1 [Symbiodinium necroappetens]|uniref:Pgk-1 protein n=1 Tax=Symbiodinium necroappetens TaxID=1628268 RepID=A0A812NIM3_9DINO|nr:pgk-1 [Symbiodinium necroappetens]
MVPRSRGLWKGCALALALAALRSFAPCFSQAATTAGAPGARGTLWFSLHDNRGHLAKHKLSEVAAQVAPYPPGAAPGAATACTGFAAAPTIPGLGFPVAWPGALPGQPLGLAQPGQLLPLPTLPTALPTALPLQQASLPVAAAQPLAPPGNDGGWTAAVAEAAAALNQLGYGAAPAATAPAAAAAPALAAPGTAGTGDPALASALASLGLTPGSLANIPGLESLANVPGLESLLGLGPQAAVGSTGVGIVPSRSRVKGKGFPPKGGKGMPKGKPSLQDLPVLTSQEVQEPQVFVTAAGQKNEKKCRALLAHKDFNRMDDKDSEQRTAVHICILKKMPEDICLSILNRDDFTEVNAVDQFGYTILSLAASNGMVSVCKAVLEHPEFTQVNSKDKWGATALHWAAASNLGAVCSAILEHPAFVEAHVVAFSFKFENQTALQVAEERGCSDAEQAPKMQVRLLTTAELLRAAKRLNVELRENVAGPWYQIELWSGDRQLGKTSGWAQPWGSLHLETIEVRKFTGYWVAKPARGGEAPTSPEDQAAMEAEEKKRYADVAKVARWFGLLLSMAIACWNRERSPFFCKEAFLLAIYDEDKQHERLVRYYKGLGFKVIKDAESIEYQDQAQSSADSVCLN